MPHTFEAYLWAEPLIPFHVHVFIGQRLLFIEKETLLQLRLGFEIYFLFFQDKCYVSIEDWTLVMR